MSLLVRDMKMPVNCCHCPLIGYDPDIEWNDGGRESHGAYICVLTHELIDNTKREDHCPLVEIPPHGRLIDADALFREISSRTKAAYEWRQKATDEEIQARADATYATFVEVALTISKLPTIIDAEGGDAE